MLQGHIDKYKLIEIKGSGTFGTVWLAEDTWIGKRVALKIPHNQKEEFTRLIAEPKLLASLDHPNVVQLITVDKAENIFFMVMEYVEGVNLGQFLQDHTLTLRDAVDLTVQILSALQYAHEKNIIHRDLKPGNILVTSDRRVKITDFGTATLTQAGKGAAGIGGTLFYMAKEQVLGHPTPLSDLYSVGVILYEMVTGQLPFFDDVPMVLLNKILKEEPARPRVLNPALPPALETIVLRALEKEPQRRFGSAQEFRQALEALASDELAVELKPGGNAAGEAAGTLLQGEKKPKREVPEINTARYRGFSYKLALTVGGRGREDGRFTSPLGVAVGEKGRIFVCDALKCNVQVFDAEGGFLYAVGKFGKEPAPEGGVGFLAPVACAIDQGGNLVVLDAKACCVQVISKSGQVVGRFGEPASPTTGKIEVGTGGFFQPQGLALDAKDNIYVADTGNHRIRVFNSTGKALNKFGNRGARLGEFNHPLGMAFDPNQQLLVVDQKNYRVQVFTHRGVFKFRFGKRGTGRGEFNMPTAVASDSAGNLFVTDQNLRVQVFDPQGYYMTEFGTPSGPYKTPPRYYGIAVDEDNRVYLTDIANCQVWVYELRK